MTVTVKLDALLEERLRLHAAGSGRSTSEIIRAALLAYLESGAAADASRRPTAFDLGHGLFGRFSGPATLAQDRKQALAEAWGAKHADARGR